MCMCIADFLTENTCFLEEFENDRRANSNGISSIQERNKVCKLNDKTFALSSSGKQNCICVYFLHWKSLLSRAIHASHCTQTLSQNGTL